MKHNVKITLILLLMFVVAQFIGLYVVDYYSPVKIVEGNVVNVTAPDLPFGLETPELKEKKDFNYAFVSILLAFVIFISLLLAYSKIYKRNIIIHNFTELLVYPGIAAIFVPILNIYTISLMLIFISVYDAWAVWHSGIMQKMAKY